MASVGIFRSTSKAAWPGYMPTRFPELGLSQIDRGTWQFVAIGEHARDDGMPAQVGPQYRTMAEALADLARYHAACWESAPAVEPAIDSNIGCGFSN